MVIDKLKKGELVKKQQGFAAVGAIVLLVVVAAVVGGGYYVLSRNSSESDSVSVQEDAFPASETVANGNPQNTVNAVNEQVSQELTKELTAMDAEDKESEVDASTVADLEAAVDEKNL